jgi:hypothetical protein
LTLSDFKLTKRGTGNPLTGPVGTCAAAVATAAPVASIAPASRSIHPRITSLFISTPKISKGGRIMAAARP